MTGVLVVDKPAGPTSHDVVARARRALGLSRVGHTGTLDPLATGVLPLVIGRATWLAQFLTADEKEYLAGVRLGVSTATYDAEGRAGQVAGPPPHVPAAALEAALEAFRGTFAQVPPAFSAKKVDGTRAYRLARHDRAIEMRPVTVTVRELELVAFEEGLAAVRLVCSSGFYVRSFAHDLGQQLGCGAHLETLRRTRSGQFHESAAVPLDTLERLGEASAAALIPPERLLTELPAVVVSARGARRLSHGNTLGPDDLEDGPRPAGEAGPIRVLDAHGALLAVARVRAPGLLHPVVVLV